MIKVYGNFGCPECEKTKKLLKENNVDFEYKMLTQIDEDEKDEVFEIAQKANRMALPIVLKDNEIIIDVNNLLKLED
ncbi:MAG: glutaredoxin family protein [archaeon]